jgi:hypothetical protein
LNGIGAKPLFAWDCLEDSPTLKTVRQFLEAIPDGALLDKPPVAHSVASYCNL